MTDITALSHRPKVLVVVDHYLPGYKAGGPIRSVSGLVQSLQEQLDFNILTRDGDYGDSHPYPNILPGHWNCANNMPIFYASKRHLSLIRLHAIIVKSNPDIIYLNGFFSSLTIKILILRSLRLLTNIPVIIAPRGEFSPGAISIKSFKKTSYIIFSKILGLYSNIIWQASADMEKKDIERIFKNQPRIFVNRIFVAPDVPSNSNTKKGNNNDRKTKGEVNFIFLSRIKQKKNLLISCTRESYL
jgi:hypothetical protein